MTREAPSTRTVLDALSKARLVALGREFGVVVPPEGTKQEQVRVLAESNRLRFQQLLSWMGREELRSACKAHGLDVAGRARQELATRLQEARGRTETQPPTAIFKAHEIPRYAPHTGDIVQVRHRQWLVEDVAAPPEEGHATLVKLVCLDDDNQGRQLEVLWELELGARVIQPEVQGLGDVTHLDPPRHFAAYLHALKWGSVTATDARLFQSPFRAGIRLMAHQLTPLKKALELPRANLFIADDVGLGKTIEAGLVVQELILRQRVDLVLIVCPASVCLQWRDEMSKRFGLRFEVYNRAFVARRRQERGFGVNPWGTHNRFIISYPTLRRPEYKEPLLQHLGPRARKSLLILDEAHTAAPATASKYAIDSRITKVIREDVAPRFENRLFLSATPHNGHSNSFSALLEILDPQRFTRGVKVTDPQRLRPVMVRRLKGDLRDVVEHIPLRRVIQVDVRQEAEAWTAADRVDGGAASAPRPIGSGPPADLQLAQMLAEYTALMRPVEEKRGAARGKLVFINLQKRLLSSVEAFWKTLKLHERGVQKAGTPAQLELASRHEEDDEYGEQDGTEDTDVGVETEQASRTLQSPAGRARELLAKLLEVAERHRALPDAKMLALLDWIRRTQCPAVDAGGARKGESRAWTDRRVLIFTEYADTKRILVSLLQTAAEGTDGGADRIMQFHGGMSDEQREEVQRAFNSPPGDHPVRILVATDAAREGVNLQGHCADLFHFDIPWNPARMEQRNGRIDRTLQDSPEVRCHYFVYPQRKEDVVLRKLVEKVDTIQRELGSLGAVVMDRLATVMDRGITSATADELEGAELAELARRKANQDELESQRLEKMALRQEIEDTGKILNSSRKVMEFEDALLEDAVNVGLELAGAGHLERVAGEDGGAQAYRVPELPSSWQQTLDHLRPPRGRDEAFWEWRKRPPMPVVFAPPKKMNSALCQLHLEHPFVRRLLQRFRAQGYSAHDLSRVTVVRNRHDALVRVIAFGRLSLFGPGATRLHDELVSVAARWLDGGGAGHLRVFAEEADRNAIRLLERILAEASGLDPVPPAVVERLRVGAKSDLATLWPHIRTEADSRAHDATQMLADRAASEAAALTKILQDQRATIEKTLSNQLELVFTDAEKDQADQAKQDRKHMQGRLAGIEREITTEPAQISDLYRVALTRLEPVGLVYLWPETRA